MKNNLKGSAILLLAAFIWGIAFVAQSAASDKIPPFAFNAVRSFIGALVLFLFWAVTAKKGERRFFPQDKSLRAKYFIAAAVCGTMLCISVNFQQVGITIYPDGVAKEARGSFLTALYVIIVPLLSLFIGKKPNLFIWIGVAVALAGVYMLCFSGNLGGFYLGDIMVLACAFCFSAHIMSVDRFVGFTGGVKLSIMQFTVCGTISLVISLIFEKNGFAVSNLIAAAPQILYLGVMSSGIAYTLQIVGQKYAEPAVASISMSFESVFGALGGWLILSNALSLKEILGCVLVFVATVVAQLGDYIKIKAK